MLENLEGLTNTTMVGIPMETGMVMIIAMGMMMITIIMADMVMLIIAIRRRGPSVPVGFQRQE
jgi:hypothetical protein